MAQGARSRSISATWLRRSPPSLSGGIRTSSATGAPGPQSVKGLWMKSRHRSAPPRPARGKPIEESALAGVPVTLPALTRALKLQTKAGKVGFDRNDLRAALRKIREEADEIEAALDADDQRQGAEVGDPSFAAAISPCYLNARSRSHAAAKDQQVRCAVSRRSSARWRRAARRRRKLYARRDGCALERGQGAGRNASGASSLILRRRQRRAASRWPVVLIAEVDGPPRASAGYTHASIAHARKVFDRQTSRNLCGEFQCKYCSSIRA